MKENSICGDNRFETIEKAKEMLLNATNIEDSKEEMKVLTNILFRMWQVGLINEEKLDINKLQKENSIEEDIKILEELRTHGYAMLLMKYEDRIKTNRKIDQALEHIVSDYKRVLKENEELKNKYATFVKMSNEVIANSIPKQKVKDKIEKEKLPLVIIGGRKNKKTLEYGIKLGRRQALRELIEERED